MKITKEKVLEVIKLWKVENDIDEKSPAIDYKWYDEGVENYYYFLEDKLSLPFCLVYRAGRDNAWLQCEYWSKALGKTIIMDGEVGDFEDDEEVADYLVRMNEEVLEIERKLPDINLCASV